MRPRSLLGGFAEKFSTCLPFSGTFGALKLRRMTASYSHSLRESAECHSQINGGHLGTQSLESLRLLFEFPSSGSQLPGTTIGRRRRNRRGGLLAQNFCLNADKDIASAVAADLQMHRTRGTARNKESQTWCCLGQYNYQRPYDKIAEFSPSAHCSKDTRQGGKFRANTGTAFFLKLFPLLALPCDFLNRKDVSAPLHFVGFPTPPKVFPFLYLANDLKKVQKRAKLLIGSSRCSGF